MTGRLSKSHGQLVAYDDWYTKVRRVPPSNNEIADFLGVFGPSAYAMIIRLDSRGFSGGRPGHPRTTRVLLRRDEISDFD